MADNIRSIWENNFYNTPPALSWTYKLDFTNFVNFTSKENVVYINKNSMDILSQSAVSINIGERKIESTDIYYGGLAFKVLTRVNNNGTFTVKFNEDENLSVTNILERLYYLFGNNKFYFSANKSIPYSYDMRNNFQENNNNINDINTKTNIISVKIFSSKCLDDNKNGNNYKQYKFYNCKLIGIEPIEYDYESTDTITRNATFTYDWLEFNTVYDNNNLQSMPSK